MMAHKQQNDALGQTACAGNYVTTVFPATVMPASEAADGQLNPKLRQQQQHNKQVYVAHCSHCNKNPKRQTHHPKPKLQAQRSARLAHARVFYLSSLTKPNRLLENKAQHRHLL
jgi:hypothetical protein